MRPELYQQVRELFDAVAGLDAAARSARLAAADPEVRREVERLLRASERGSWLDAPAAVETRPTPAERWEGRRLGPYELLSEIGQGGMGIVYLARRADGAFQKQVAVKIIRQDLATPSFLARFQREREILARLEHPNIARLLDGGTTPNGLAYLVMEYIAGEPLLEFAASRRLPYDDRLRLLAEIAAAVDYAHEQGVIHRDLKPSNIFVDRRGHVKLLDFGIAAWQPRSAAEAEIAPTIALSPAYASPEQARGEHTTRASDVYSFAMVAYELLAGVLPFPLRGLSLPEVLAAIGGGVPLAPSAAVRQSAHPKPAALAAARGMAAAALVERLELTADAPLLRALAKRPEERPESAGALARELAAPAAAPEPRWRRAVARIAGAWGELALFAALLPGLTAVGLVQAKPLAWAIWGGVVALAALRRSGGIPLGSTVVLGGAGLLVGFAAARAPGWQGPGWAEILLAAAVVAAAAGMAAWHVRASARLGERVFRSRRLQLVLVAVLALLAVSAADDWFATPRRGVGWVYLLLTLAAAQGLLPFDIRRGGVVAGLTVLPWRELAGYRWVSPEVLELRRRRRALGGECLKVAVRGEDRERIEELLDEWIANERRERPLFTLLEDSR
jgi:serine/threonine protein kinase